MTCFLYAQDSGRAVRFLVGVETSSRDREDQRVPRARIQSDPGQQALGSPLLYKGGSRRPERRDRHVVSGQQRRERAAIVAGAMSGPKTDSGILQQPCRMDRHMSERHGF